MSSSFVRNEFRNAWATLVPSVPLYDTVNTDPDHDGLEDLWATIEFVSNNNERISLGETACYREQGTITVVLSVKSGDGDANILAASELIREAYKNFKSGGFRLTQIDPALPLGFSDGNWYLMDIDMSYDYDTFN